MSATIDRSTSCTQEVFSTFMSACPILPVLVHVSACMRLQEPSKHADCLLACCDNARGSSDITLTQNLASWVQKRRSQAQNMSMPAPTVAPALRGSQDHAQSLVEAQNKAEHQRMCEIRDYCVHDDHDCHHL